MKKIIVLALLPIVLLTACSDDVPKIDDPHNVVVDGQKMTQADFLQKYCISRAGNETCDKVKNAMDKDFCIYNDVALAVARARADGLRVLYVDLDVHHGDGVQATFFRDPGALTLSDSPRAGGYLFPQTGHIDEVGEGSAAGTSVNLPLEPYTGEHAWLAAVRSLVPTLAAVFGPDVVVSQHGADSHAWDPLAHLRVTTTAMAEAARLVDAVSHRWASGRWLATGGGGYDAYRVVPRAWALTWLAGAHREVPDGTRRLALTLGRGGRGVRDAGDAAHLPRHPERRNAREPGAGGGRRAVAGVTGPGAGNRAAAAGPGG